MSQLFSPLQLRDLTLSNRIMVSPMCQYMAEDGRAGAWHMIHLGNLALSGAGMVCIEATAVTAQGRITHGDLGLYDDATEAALKPVVEAMRQYSKAAVVMQLGHAGRKASSQAPWDGGQQVSLADGGWLGVAPSALPHKEDEAAPLALDAGGMAEIRDAYVATARRADRLGLDGLELHAAHGYLLHQFLSPLSNQRTDDYGGSLANRMRFVLEVFDAVRAEFPAGKPVGVRLSATDWVDGGWDLPQTLVLAEELRQRGVDWIDASSAGVSPLQQIPVGAGYQVPFAEAIRHATGIPTIAVGLITEAAQAEEIIASGQADLVALGRGILYNPRWPWHAAAELGGTVDAPKAYWRAPPRGQAALFGDTKFGAR
ncbi:MAG: NADH:flavin oxidoreductase/NADH oxidase [Comamonadaceae bacterium]|nr:MAG: NADH:flavin oxidoreductase/NADH oxidase [Comamonadaceae bacterium]